MRRSKLPSILMPRLRHLLLPGFAAVALLVSACGSSTPAHHPQSSKPSHAQSPKPAHAAKADVTLTQVSGYGQALASATGKPLFLLTADPTGSSKCTGACATTWVPLEASGTPTAGSGINSSLLSTFKRADGTEQVLYNGHALYTHPGGSAAAVAGSASDGGIWYLVSADGNAITKTSGGGY